MKMVVSSITLERQAEIIRAMDEGSSLNSDYLLLIMLSCIIATFGLVLDSAAVVIGAMLIAPLMTPILRCSLALVRGNFPVVWRALITLVVSVILAIGLRTLLGFLVSISSIGLSEELSTEILTRTQPILFDMIIALAGGAAAAYALVQPKLSATLPGVAIATALMPPLSTVGVGLSQGRLDVASGALPLFIVNITAIIFASSTVFALLGFRASRVSERKITLIRALIIEILLLVIVSIPLISVTSGIIRDIHDNRVIHSELRSGIGGNGEITLVSFEKYDEPDFLHIVATVRSIREIKREEIRQIQEAIALQLQRPAELQLLIVPVTSLDPFQPPSITPTPTQ